MTLDAAVTFQDVFFSYNTVFSLRDVSFTISSGEFVGIIGPNGSGKTTLIKLLLGLLEPSQGEISLFGKPPLEIASRIGYVPQTFHLDKQFPISVMELVLTGRLSSLPWYGKYQKKDIEIASHALSQVGLSHVKNDSFGSLSTGQAQRVLIARALATKPRLLVLDEPTASVDPESAQDILHILQKLKGDMTILMVTHDLKTIIKDTQKVITVQKTTKMMSSDEVCEHFGFGLYHTPMIPNVEH